MSPGWHRRGRIFYGQGRIFYGQGRIFYGQGRIFYGQGRIFRSPHAGSNLRRGTGRPAHGRNQ
jgi:hypothetical protein